MTWEELDSPPNWVVDAIGNDFHKQAIPATGTQISTCRGDTYVYKVEYEIEAGQWRSTYYRQLKSDYHDTTREEATCPNCQKYVRRLDGDYFLTCHRCGWQYRTPPDMLRYAIDRLLGRTE